MFQIPKAYVTSLSTLYDRHTYIETQFSKYSLDYEIIMGYDGRQTNLNESAICDTRFKHQMNSGEIGTVLTHLKAIETWLKSSDETEKIGFFCEDDIFLETIKYIPFTWDELISNLPKGWTSLQLGLLREEEINEDRFKLHRRVDENWSVGCYILPRVYAKRLTTQHIQADGSFNLDLPAFPNTIPFPENIIYSSFGTENCYTLPLFTENKNIPSSFYPNFIQHQTKEVGNGGRTQNDNSEAILHWWKTQGRYKSLDWFF